MRRRKAGLHIDQRDVKGLKNIPHSLGKEADHQCVYLVDTIKPNEGVKTGLGIDEKTSACVALVKLESICPSPIPVVQELARKKCTVSSCAKGMR